MATDDDRRDVARRLRNLPGDSTYPDLIGVIADRDGWYPAADAADRLADLIEPDHVGDSNKMVDRDALLALADELEEEAGSVCGVCMGKSARRIREALGVES